MLVDDIEDPENVVTAVIDDLTHALTSLPAEKVVERSCHLTKRGCLLRKMGEIM